PAESPYTAIQPKTTVFIIYGTTFSETLGRRARVTFLERMSMNNRNRIRPVLLVLVILVFVVFLLACEVDMTVAVDGKNPPTFKLSGSGNLISFLVMDVPPEN